MFYRQRHTDWRVLMGSQPGSAEHRPRSCGQARRLAEIWRWKAYVARSAYNQWVESSFVLRDYVVGPGANAWLHAVEEAQKPYPNTGWWLKSCSADEGGWGRWVPNSDGYPPGGWMQMYSSTFWRMWRGALADLTKRGFEVPSSAASWYSPLGQALASAWGFLHGSRGEWAGAGC